MATGLVLASGGLLILTQVPGNGLGLFLLGSIFVPLFAVFLAAHLLNTWLAVAGPGDADGLVCGLNRSYPDTIRPALQIIRLKEGVTLPAPGDYGVGMVFLPADEEERAGLWRALRPEFDLGPVVGSLVGADDPDLPFRHIFQRSRQVGA